ncbi:hypothetical protein BOX15_Mlig018360g2 [Macrostomum lignano]|uniref:Transmembrane protein n=1 Tax=Macrostomum lignano TaxID=282301 RepID=A0A267H629_9PLAT|nr:hypothetical protein BOX15_Mlig018360g2 [Macrostomum lignano]
MTTLTPTKSFDSSSLNSDVFFNSTKQDLLFELMDVLTSIDNLIGESRMSFVFLLCVCVMFVLLVMASCTALMMVKSNSAMVLAIRSAKSHVAEDRYLGMQELLTLARSTKVGGGGGDSHGGGNAASRRGGWAKGKVTIKGGVSGSDATGKRFGA